MDALYKAIVEALARRGQQERDRREEWERSLKPTQYLGDNLFQEMGGQPIEGRYLGKRSLIPGQFVPNIGRNPNKPVIPGLPNPVQDSATIEEVSPQQIFYNGIFTIDSPLDDTDFTELQMLNRVENRAPGDSTVTPWTNPQNHYSELHQTTFYYFNSKQNIQELFTHKNSQRLFRGIALIPAFAGESQDPPEWETVYSVANPGNVICDITSLRNQNSYFTIYFTNSLNLDINYLINFRVVNENENTVGITDGFAFTSRYTKSGLKIAVAQGAIRGGSSSNLQFQMLRGDNNNALNIEVRIVKTFDGYMTTTEKGTTFAFYGCGNEDYPPYNKRFSKNGKNPSSLTSIDADPETNIPPAPNWDWRQGLVTGTAMINFPNLAYRFHSHAFNLSSKRGFYCYKDVFLRDTDYPGLLSVITPMILDKFTVSEYDNSQGVIDYSQSGVLSFLSIKPLATDVNGTLFLKSINVEIQNIQDFCIPNKWNDNVQVRSIDHFPYIQVIQA